MEPLRMDADEDRKPRTMEEMMQEVEWLKTFFKDVEESEGAHA
jgi:bis(5'-adenosyl)-triphosphatase